MNHIVFSSWGGRVVDNRGKEPDEFETPDKIDLPEHFGEDEAIRALIGWDGIVIRSEDVDVVDLCRAYITVVNEHSCGKCIPCRTGTGLMADTLKRICAGAGVPGDLEMLESLAQTVVDTAKCNIGQFGPVALAHALKYFRKDFSEAVAAGAARSAGSYRSAVSAPCMDACPIHLDIPRYVELIKEGCYQESLDVIRDRLPLPGIVGRVCVRPCEEHCRRANIDEPISIKFLKRFVADRELAMGRSPHYTVEPSPNTGRVAVVGAGPAGVTCAYHLARRGHRVTVYERHPEPGGMSAFGIPDYRLPRPILQGEVNWVRDMGVTIHYNTAIGRDIPLSRLEEDFDAVFIGIGAQ
jgi:formate dehydrogenase beta subunit